MKTKTKLHDKTRQLFDLAMAQGGFFTTSQAESLGFHRQNHARMVDGQWEKVARGIFRHRLAPSSGRHDDLHVLQLFFRRRCGSAGLVFSGETAASLLGIGDFNPGKTYAYVESSVRKGAAPPAPLDIKTIPSLTDKDSAETADGLLVTTPMQTLMDLITVYERDLEEIRRSYLAARNAGKIKKSALAAALGRCGDAHASSLFKKWEETLDD